MNKWLSDILPWFLCFTVSCICAQQDLELCVHSTDDKSPIQYAEVYHHQSSIIELTDKDGKVLFSELSEGRHDFSIFLEGYQTVIASISLPGESFKQVYLERLNYKLTTMDIVAQKQEHFAIRQLNDIEGTSVYAGKKTEVVILDMIKGNLATNNGRQIYAQVAGLNIYEGNDGGLQLNLGGRGLDPNRTSNFNTRQNGYDISADVLGYPENYYTPPTEALSEIRIVRGASSLQYGTQFGGLVDFRIKKIPNFKKFQLLSTQTLSSFNGFSSFNSIGINKGRSSVNAFYNYKRGNGYRPNSEYEAHNIFLAYDFNIGQRTTLAAELTYYNYLARQAGGLTDSQFASDSRLSTRDRNWFTVDWRLYNVKANHEFINKSKLELSLFGLDASRKSVGFRGNPINLNENPITALDEKDATGQYVLNRDLIAGDFNNYGAEAKFLTEWNADKLFKVKSATLLIGAKYFNSNNSSRQGPGSRGSDPDFEFYHRDFPNYSNQSDFSFPNINVSLFSENIFYISDRLSITPGFRAEHIKTESIGSYNQVVFDNAGNAIANNLLEDNRVLDRRFVLFGLGMEYDKSDELQVIANLSQNYRSVTFSDIRIVSPSSIVDPDIKDERGLTFDVGFKVKSERIFTGYFTVYSVLYEDRIGVIINDKAQRERKNIGSAIIAGTESLLSLNALRWLKPEQRTFGCDLFVNTAFTFSEYLKSEENNVVGKRVEFIPVVNLKAGINFRFKQAELSYQFSYLSQQFTDVQNSSIAEEGDLRSGIIGPIPAYQVSDLTLAARHKNLRFKAGINNLMNRAYYTRRATGYPGPGIIPSDRRSFFASLSFVID